MITRIDEGGQRSDTLTDISLLKSQFLEAAPKVGEKLADLDIRQVGPSLVDDAIKSEINNLYDLMLTIIEESSHEA